MNINETNKFPIGTHKQQCIGPCFPENTILINPLTLVMGSADNPVCPVLPWNNNGQIEYFDQCEKPISAKKAKQISLNYVVPIVHFNCEYFLKTYYDLYSFEVIEDAGNKIESEYLPKKRARKFKRNLDLKGLFYTIWKIDTYFILSELNENSTELN